MGKNNVRNALLNKIVIAEANAKSNKKVENKEEKKYDVSSLVNESAILELTDDKEISSLLIESSNKIVNIQVKNSLELGEVFSNVFDTISRQGSKFEGLYEKWLTVNGVNKRTALRYRKRFELYSEVEEKAKNTIAVLPQGYIEFISSEENKDKYVTLLNEGIEAKEIINMIKQQDVIENKVEEDKEVEIVDYSFNEYKNIFSIIDKKSETLKEKEKMEIKSYLDKINKILNKNNI